MDTNSGISKIGELDFLDIKVPIFYDPIYEGSLTISWGIRNPDSEYQGIIYYDSYTNKHRLPDGVEEPKQTEKDREKLPKFIIIGKPDLKITRPEGRGDLNILNGILEDGYRRHNPKLWRGHQINKLLK